MTYDLQAPSDGLETRRPPVEAFMTECDPHLAFLSICV